MTVAGSDYQFQCLGAHQDAPAGARQPLSLGFAADIHHRGFALFVDMCQLVLSGHGLPSVSDSRSGARRDLDGFREDDTLAHNIQSLVRVDQPRPVGLRLMRAG